jgi:hypothetical protein
MSVYDTVYIVFFIQAAEKMKYPITLTLMCKNIKLHNGKELLLLLMFVSMTQLFMTMEFIREESGNLGTYSGICIEMSLGVWAVIYQTAEHPYIVLVRFGSQCAAIDI